MEEGFAESLLRGPRGRRLCAAVLTTRSLELWEQLARAGLEPGDAALQEQLARSVDATEVTTTSYEEDPAAFLPALREAVREASYWQQPDAEDRMLAAPGLLAALLPVARALGEASATAWWRLPVDPGQQYHVAFAEHGAAEPPRLGRSAEALVRWRRAATAEEHRAADERSADPRSSWSGSWWSAPTGLVATSRSLGAHGAVGLQLTEDGIEWPEACLQHLRPQVGARVFEIDGPEAWTELVARYPVEVTASRRHDWWRSTGGEERWLLPDWTRVAEDWDGVHLSVLGYLSAAGRRLPAGGDYETVLAGWDPDATYWLADVLEPVGGPAHWLRERDEDDEGAGWTPVPVSELNDRELDEPAE